MASASWLTPAVHRLIDLALEEDLGRGDVTTDAVIGPEVQARGRIVSRESVVVAGAAVAVEVFRRIDPDSQVAVMIGDGAEAAEGAVVLQLSGPAASLLRAERTALNFLQ